MTTCFFSGQTTIVPLVIGKKAAEGHYCGADHGHFCGADAMKDALSNLKVKRGATDVVGFLGWSYIQTYKIFVLVS